MRTLEESNPIATAVFFLCAAGIAMFSRDPVITALSLIGAIILWLLQGGKGYWFAAVLFVAGTLVNPLFNHKGNSVLFVLNNNPVTLEALLYGALSSAMVVATIYWFRSFSKIMTSDKLLYVLGSAMPKLSLILSMALRYVPLFSRQAKTVSDAQKTMGLYREENLIDSMRGKIRVFSVMVTWTLENGIVTADSMESRGYSAGRRSFFAIYKFTAQDAVLLLTSLLMTGISLLAMYGGEAAAVFQFYPVWEVVSVQNWPIQVWVSYVSYGVLVLSPLMAEIGEGIKWKYLQSKI